MLKLLKNVRKDLNDIEDCWNHFYWFDPSTNYMSPGVHEKIVDGKSNNGNILGQLFKTFYYVRIYKGVLPCKIY